MIARFSTLLLLLLAAGVAVAADAPAPKNDEHSSPRQAKAETEKGIFPKSIPIRGTSVSVDFGGYAKVDFIQDFDGIGNRDQFQTNTIHGGAEIVGVGMRV